MISLKETDAGPVTLRLAGPADQAFLYQLYCSTRIEEIEAWGLEGAARETLLKLQFTARERHFDIAYPEAEHQIIICDDNSIGRIVVFRLEREIRLVDVALLPEHRGKGTGAALVLALCAEAQAAGKPVTLHVAKSNRAARLYQRLGFCVADDIGTDYKMEWRPDG